jgi:ABC-2 type transport system permease protein
MGWSRASIPRWIGDARADAALYRYMTVARLRSQLQYRGSFLVMTIVSTLGLATEFIGILILFSAFDTLASWDVGEVALLYGLASLSFGIAEMVGAGFDVFPTMIRRGEFDQVLLRPAGVFSQVLSSDFPLRRLGRISQGAAVLVLALAWTSVDWTLGKLLYLPLAISSGVVVFVALFIFGATLCFWTVESIELINILTYGGTELTSYPLPIYHELMQRFFVFIVPLAFVSYFPALYILDRPEARDWPGWLPFASPLAALLLALAARVAWGFGVRHYRSTGS